MQKIYSVWICALVSFIFSLQAHGQVYTGGSFGVHFENGNYYVDAAPLLGYRYKMIDMGISPFFAYREYKDRPDAWSFGNRVFAQVTFMPNVFAHAEFEVSNIETNVIGSDGKRERKWIMGLPVGGGYRYRLSSNAEAYGLILYDVLLDKDSPVKNPIIRGGVVYNF